jgi:tetraacyldisaccharide 4'-kinase
MSSTKGTLRLVFSPVSFLWETLYRLRRFLFDVGFFHKSKYSVPIISVGNLTLGGTGKTPMTLWLGHYLNEKKKKVMVLSRGYKGQLENDSGIIRSGGLIEKNPVWYGDEALVICRGLENASVVVGKKRAENLEHYFHEEQPDVVLLDDGHQHLKIDRKLNIVLFDSTLPLDRYHAPPLGYLREGMSALRDADIVIFGRVDIVDQKQLSKLQKLVRSHCEKQTPFASFYYAPTSINDLYFKEVMTPADLRGKEVICITGIASPQSFYELIAKEGGEVIEKFEFPDHHYYEAEEIERIIKVAKERSAIILTTEKDIVKIRRVSNYKDIYYVDINIKFLSGEEELMRLVDSVIF